VFRHYDCMKKDDIQMVIGLKWIFLTFDIQEIHRHQYMFTLFLFTRVFSNCDALVRIVQFSIVEYITV
jgi:hypothetical protein